MIKSKLILKLYEKYSSLSLSDIEKILDLFLNHLVKGLQNNQKIELRGFGTFSKKINKEKFVRNPKTSQKIFKKENYKMHFKIGNILHKKINSTDM